MIWLSATVTQLADVLPDPSPTPSFVIDLLDLQWWQTILVLLGILGFSPAPWIAALSTGRLLFRADFVRQLAEKIAEHARALAANDKAHDEAMTAKDRAHENEMKEIRDHHDAVLTLERQRYSDLKEAFNLSQSKNGEYTDAAFEMVEVVKANSHIMASIDTLGKKAIEENGS